MKGGTTVKKDFLTLQKMFGKPLNEFQHWGNMNHATLREGSGKGFLFHGRQMVLGGAPDGDSEVSEAKTISDKGSPHFISI